MRVENNNHCFVCGRENPYGLQVNPDIAPDGTQVKIEYTPPSHFQGWANIVHGGILSTLLDEAITYVGIAYFDSPAVTAQIEIRFKKPALTGNKLIVTANRVKAGKRLIEAAAHIELEDGTRIAEGTGKVMKVDVSLQPAFDFSPPQKVCELPPSAFALHDLSPDGKRFVARLTRAHERELNVTQVNVVVGWFE